MSEPLISVVIPSYNCAGYLKLALASVIKQTYKNFEIIVVNNFSTDNTIEIINSFNDRRITRIDFHNQGVIGAARNRGIEAAKGDWVAFLDADDLWESSKLSEVVRVIQAGPVDLICHDEMIIDETGTQIGKLSYGPEWRATYEHLLFDRNCISTSATTVKRDLLKKVGLFSEKKEFVTTEDYELWLKLAQAGAKMFFIKRVLGAYRVHQSSSSRSLYRHHRAHQAVFDYHWQTFMKGVALIRVAQRHAIIWYGTGRVLWSMGQTKKAFIFFLKAYQYYKWLPKNLIMLAWSAAKKLSAKVFPNQYVASVYSPPKRVKTSQLATYYDLEKVIPFSLARHALVEGIKRFNLHSRAACILVPEYICRDLLAAFYQTNVRVVFYQVNDRLRPISKYEELPRCDAILMVNYFGHPQELDYFANYCKKNQAILIEDNAHGFLSRDEVGRSLGFRGDFGIISVRKSFPFFNGALLCISKKLDGPERACEFFQAPSIGFKVKCLLRYLTPIMGAPGWQISTKFIRSIKKVFFGHEIAPSLPRDEQELPRNANPCNFIAQLHKLDLDYEIKRRRKLYLMMEQRLIPLGARSVFEKLDSRVVPYVYPFIVEADRIEKIKDSLFALGLECFPWPALPDAIKVKENHFYKNIWCVRFMW